MAKSSLRKVAIALPFGDIGGRRAQAPSARARRRHPPDDGDPGRAGSGSGTRPIDGSGRAATITKLSQNCGPRTLGLLSRGRGRSASLGVGANRCSRGRLRQSRARPGRSRVARRCCRTVPLSVGPQALSRMPSPVLSVPALRVGREVGREGFEPPNPLRVMQAANRPPCRWRSLECRCVHGVSLRSGSPQVLARPWREVACGLVRTGGPLFRMPSKTALATFAATSAMHLPLKARGPTRGPVQAPLDGAPRDLYEPVWGTPLCRNLPRTPRGGRPARPPTSVLAPRGGRGTNLRTERLAHKPVSGVAAEQSAPVPSTRDRSATRGAQP
jgi:hypothetical protein